MGLYALANTPLATRNTANGMFALLANTDGGFNTANGSPSALFQHQRHRQHGQWLQALLNNNRSTTRDGFQALSSNPPANLTLRPVRTRSCASITGAGNVAMALKRSVANTTGESNHAIGSFRSMATPPATTTRLLGASAGNGVTTANNVTCIEQTS